MPAGDSVQLCRTCAAMHVPSRGANCRFGTLPRDHDQMATPAANRCHRCIPIPSTTALYSTGGFAIRSGHCAIGTSTPAHDNSESRRAAPQLWSTAAAVKARSCSGTVQCDGSRNAHPRGFQFHSMSRFAPRSPGCGRNQPGTGSLRWTAKITRLATRNGGTIRANRPHQNRAGSALRTLAQVKYPDRTSKVLAPTWSGNLSARTPSSGWRKVARDVAW